jgi:cell division septum initiation protein DivIVA
MSDGMDEQQSELPLDVAGAMTAARELLAAAEADAAELRSETARYVRQRESEAELLVAKARRILSVAEEKAAGILAAARSQAVVIDLETPVVPVPLAELTDDQFRRIVSPSASSATGLDDMLASAIAHAVDRALSPERRPER